jgi:hypothetical protein
MANYTKLAATAKRLIEKNGAAVTLRRPPTEQAVLNASQPWRGNDPAAAANAGGQVEQAAKAVLLDWKLADGSADTTRRGMKRALVAANSVPGVDLADYTALVDPAGTVWKIDGVNPLAPGGITLLFELTLKK